MADTTTSNRPAKRTSNGGSRRDELLAIAARVFANKGIASATVRDIAQEAGILSGSLYHHFASKEEMVREIIGPGGSPQAPTYREIFDTAPNAEEAMRRSMRDAVRWVADHPDVARIFRNDAQYISETPALAESEERRQSNRLIWIEIVDAGIADGVFRRDLDSDIAVRAMWDAVLASIRWFPPLGDADPEVIGDQLAELFIGGMRTRRR